MVAMTACRNSRRLQGLGRMKLRKMHGVRWLQSWPRSLNAVQGVTHGNNTAAHHQTKPITTHNSQTFLYIPTGFREAGLRAACLSWSWTPSSARGTWAFLRMLSFHPQPLIVVQCAAFSGPSAFAVEMALLPADPEFEQRLPLGSRWKSVRPVASGDVLSIRFQSQHIPRSGRLLDTFLGSRSFACILRPRAHQLGRGRRGRLSQEDCACDGLGKSIDQCFRHASFASTALS